MRKICFIIWALPGFSSLSFSGSYEDAQQQVTDFCSSLRHDSLMAKIERVCDNDESYPGSNRYNSLMSREIVNGYTEEILCVMIKAYNEQGQPTGYYPFSIYLIYAGNQLFFYRICSGREPELGYEKSDYEANAFAGYTDTNRINTFKDVFARVYKTALNFDELFTTTIVYGAYCGISGQDPEYREKLNLLVAKKESKILIQWLRSPVAEIQLYAVDGLLQLYDQHKFKPDDEVIQLVKLIGAKKGDAYTCSGCMHKYEPISDVVMDLLKKYDYPLLPEK